jgi:NADPH:quinone reductase-like Zn-dependent oxidoreductase
MDPLPLRIAASCIAALSLAGPGLAQAPAPGAAPKMRAIVHRSYGGPEVLRLEEIERPACPDDRALVRVRAASVNPLDWHYLRGTPYLMRGEAGLLAPKNPGLGVDFAGVVEAVGLSVAGLKPGDEVFGNRFGAFAEYVCALERAVALKPAGATFEAAAAVPVAGITALQALRDAGALKPGEKVLVNGASGGVGTFAVQIAKSMGAEVTGVCSTRNVELVRSLGADHVVDYTREDFTRGERRYDLIVDMVGSHSASDCRRVLTSGGRLVIVGNTDRGRWLGPMAGMLRALTLAPFVSQRIGGMLAQVNRKDLAILADLMQAGTLRSVIDRRYRLADVPEAIRYLEGGHARGKVVIAVDPADAPPASTGPAAASTGEGPGSLALDLAVAVAFAVGPIVAALALNRRFQLRHPGMRPYRWGYWFAIQALLGGMALGAFLEAGAGVAVACAAVYAALAWSFARRRRWAWIALTILTFNPVAWIVNALYLKKRWSEDAAAAATS